MSVFQRSVDRDVEKGKEERKLCRERRERAYKNNKKCEGIIVPKTKYQKVLLKEMS